MNNYLWVQNEGGRGDPNRPEKSKQQKEKERVVDGEKPDLARPGT